MSLKNHQYDIVLREYDSRQAQAKYNLDRRREEIYKKFPDISDIENQIAADSVRSARLAILGDASALEGLSEKIKQLSRTKKELLVKYGYPSNYLMMHYVCDDCQDTGYINNERCHCFRQALSRLIYLESNLSAILDCENFSHFKYDLYSDKPEDTDYLLNCTPYRNIINVVNTAKEYIDNFDSSYNNLLIYGNTGVGKTFLTNCIAKELLDRFHTVQYYTASQFFSILEKNKFNNGSSDDILEQAGMIYDCDVLIIDDIGTELANAFTVSQLYTCINERHLKRLSTIISTNLSYNRIKDTYSERIFSRFSKHYTLLKIIGRDIRLM